MSNISSKCLISKIGAKNSLHLRKYSTWSCSEESQSLRSFLKGSAILFYQQLLSTTMKMEERDSLSDVLDFDQIFEKIIPEGKLIGTGVFGAVYEIETKKGHKYAAKILDIEQSQICEVEKRMERERRIPFTLNHANIIKTYKCIEKSNQIIYILELCEAGNLKSFLHTVCENKAPLNVALKISRDVLKGLKYLHSNQIIHRDIKDTNILVAGNQTKTQLIFKIADFSFIRSIQLEKAASNCGTYRYKAPEIFENKCYNGSCDIWSFGVLFFRIIFGNFPFQNYFDIKKKCSSPQCLEVYFQDYFQNETIKQFFKRVFVMDPKQRIKIDEFPRLSLFAQIKEELIQQFEKIDNQSKIIKTFEKEDIFSDQMRFQYEKIQFLIQFEEEIQRKQISLIAFNLEQRLVARVYLLKIIIMLLSSLKDSSLLNHPPFQMQDLIGMDLRTWSSCLLNYDFKGLIEKIDQDLSKSKKRFLMIFDDAEELNEKKGISHFLEIFTPQIPKNFEQIKAKFRAYFTIPSTKILNRLKDYSMKVKNQMLFKLFCCNQINKIFERPKLKQRFPLFYLWIELSEFKMSCHMDLRKLKEWMEQESAEGLKKSMRIFQQKFNP